MKHELVCLENKWEEINKFIFYAAEHNLDNLSIPAQTTKNVSDIFDNSKFSAIVSYPIGSSEPQIKLHEVMLCTSRNIKKIDYTINIFDLENFNIRAILSELKSAYQICKDKKATLRPILEYKFLSYQDTITLINGMASLGIEEMIIGTSYSVDNYHDNMIVSRFIQDKFSINIISSAPIISQEQYDEFHKNHIFGLRIKSYKLLDNLCIK